MAIGNDSDREIMAYIQFLLDHGSECQLTECPSCSTLHSLCDQAADRLFGSRHYQRGERSISSNQSSVLGCQLNWP